MEEKQLSDYLYAFRRHKLAFVGIFAVIMTVAALTANLLPPIYRSTSTILIEEQEIPTDLVRSTITTYAAQRLQTISQRVMTRSNLLTIIDKFNLYKEKRENSTTDEIIAGMRSDISFETVSADVIDPRSGRPTQATIAFTLSYDGKVPGLVQKIANEITSLYLEENLRMRTQQTAEASDFLTNEAKQIANYIEELEQKLSKFKEAHLKELPEQKQLTLQVIDRRESEIKELDLQIRSLQERNFLIESQIGQISPESPVISSTGQRVMSPTERLKALRTELIGLIAQYSEKHPDVVKARQEIEALERQVGQVGPDRDQIKKLDVLKTQRASLSEKYAGNHPDIASLDKRIAALEESIQSNRVTGDRSQVRDEYADNPAYLNLVAQRQSNNLEIGGLEKRRAELKNKLLEEEKHMQNYPDVERQYLALLRDLENASSRYRELKAKQMEAQIAEQLERKSKGERFSLIEPPQLPEKPIKPNRPAIVLLGFVLALAAAGGYVALRETLDKSIRKTGQILAIAGAMPLAVIPYVRLEEDIEANRRRMWLILGVAAAGIVLLLLAVHWFVTPLDVLWFRGLRKVDKTLG